MAISKEDIKKLADLARIEVGEAEQEKLAGEIGEILGYVDQVSKIVVNDKNTGEGLSGEALAKSEGGVNVMREDANPTESGTYTDKILDEAPATENGYIKVKKIL